ncbi:MAG TPA: DUF1501 domain-containing protein [Planctomycetes bacterium]|nr:DUF1501 domain-containing protein [Planctomycetota bacterium]HIL38023.1 DUF1501 domain-containing protein [Planctomycetota bacterium]
MRPFNRRDLLGHMSSGLGAMAMAELLNAEGLLKNDQIKIDPGAPHAARNPHFKPRARNVVVIFCSGALSHIDSFDYKPELIKRHDTPLPGSDGLLTFQGANGNLQQPLYPFRPRGECGKMTSELLPHIGELSDDLCYIHSLHTKTATHGPGENCMSTGYIRDGFPSMGAWATYALGSENSNLPAFVAIPDPRGVPQSSLNNWGSGFLPAAFQGTPFNAATPVRNLNRPSGISEKEDLATRAFLRTLNKEHLKRYAGDTEMAARISSYEMAARMQLSVPEVTDFSSEPLHIRKLYGTDDPNVLKAGFARNCLLARRLIERGVRFVQLFNGAYAMGEGKGNWDGHKQLKTDYDIHGPILDQPAAALIRDLKQRGLLEETLVVLCTEFGRMPTFQEGTKGRDHNPSGFTAILAGAGVKAPFTHGSTDEFGWKAARDPVSVHDFHATILHLLGLDHTRLTYYHNGLERRLTDVHGRIVDQILS